MSIIPIRRDWLPIALGSAALAFTTAASVPVFAQDAGDADLGDEEFVVPTEEESELDLSEDEGEVIVITGSALPRRVVTTPAPVAVLDKSDLDAAGKASIGEILQSLPSQSNAINIQVNNGGNGATRVNLRGIGAARTLVLVNGRRHVPGGNGANSSVDLNAIPTAIIERVEVLKDGASALYGSDAIGGVVNIITRSDFEGTEASAFLGTTQDGLGTVYDLSVVSGYNSEKGNVVFSAGYVDQQPMGAGDRDYAFYDYRYDWEEGEEITVGSTATPNGTIIIRDEDTPGNANWDRLLETCPSGACFYDPATDTWNDFNSVGVDDPNLPMDEQGDFYNYQPENYLLTPNNRYNIFASGKYKFHDNVNGFFESTFMNRTSDQKLAAEPLFTASEEVSISGDNVYNPFGRDILDLRRRLREFGNRRFLQDINTFRIVGGLQGEIPQDVPFLNGWRWEVSGNFGTTRSNEVNEGRLNRVRLLEAIGPSYYDEEGVARCGTVDNPGDSRCVPLNLFGGYNPDNPTITEEMQNWLTYTGTAKGFSDQMVIQANALGKVVNLPGGGDVAMAMGVSYRDESGGDQPDPLTATGDTTGNKSEPTEGGYNVAEGFVELNIVPIVRQPFAEWVELTAAVRAFDYDTFGSGAKGKVGALWRVGTELGLSVRGTLSNAFRAPNVSELYSGQFDGFPSVTDPCDVSDGPLPTDVATRCMNTGAPADHVDAREQLKARSGGNPELDPEEAVIFTGGGVITPKFVPGLAVTVDYFNIRLDDPIQTIGASTTLSNCYDRGIQESCDLITRDGAGFILEIGDTLQNIGKVKTSGIDFNVRYDYNTLNLGNFRFNLEGTWLQKYTERTPDGTLLRGRNVYDLGHYPEWKGNLSALWARKAWGATARLKYIGNIQECVDDDCNTELGRELDADDPMDTRQVRDVGASVTGDVSGSYTLRSNFGTTRLSAGVNNVLDRDPERIYNGFTASSEPSAYDFLGRYYYVRFVQSF